MTFVSDTWEGQQMFMFTSEDFSGEVGECDEGELRWVPIPEIFSLPLWEGDKIFLRLLFEASSAFLLKLTYRGNELVSAELDGRSL